MSSIHKILVAVDFSDASHEAFHHAVGFAKELGAELHVLHCYAIDLRVLSPYGVTLPKDFEAKAEQAAARKLHEWCSQEGTEGLEIQEHSSATFPAQEIPSRAQELGCDLIVMGTRGLSGVKHVLLGSVAERVVRTAHCPVLTVKQASAA